MNYKDIFVIEKRNIITDLRYKSFLFVDFCRSSSETHALKNLLRWSDDFLYQAMEGKLPQIQIQFPCKWQKLASRLKHFGYHSGLYVIEKRLNRSYSLPKNIRKIYDATQIKKQLAKQQRIHFQFNPVFFDDPKAFRYSEYLGDLQKRIDMREGVLYGLYYREMMIGFIGLEIDNSGVYVNELFVEKKYRGKGFGKILTQAGFHYVTNTPHRKIWTTLAVQNDRGLRFYKSCGFHEIAQIDFMNCKNPCAAWAGGRRRAQPVISAPACVAPFQRTRAPCE